MTAIGLQIQDKIYDLAYWRCDTGVYHWRDPYGAEAVLKISDTGVHQCLDLTECISGFALGVTFTCNETIDEFVLRGVDYVSTGECVSWRGSDPTLFATRYVAADGRDVWVSTHVRTELSDDSEGVLHAISDVLTLRVLETPKPEQEPFLVLCLEYNIQRL